MNFEIVTTKNCNLNCKYCFEGTKQKIYMASSDISKILSFIEKFGEKDFVSNKDSIHIDFNGGETLLNKKFIKQFLKESESLNYSYSFTTNGTLIDDEIIELIKRYNIFLQISLDGIKKVHDLNRCFYSGDGSFEIVISKLKEIQKKCGNDSFQIASVVTPQTVIKFADNFNFFLDNGFNNITSVGCSDYKWSEQDYIEYEKQLHLIGNRYIESFEKNINVNFSIFNKNIENMLDGIQKRKCDAIAGEIAILPDGNILPCGGFVGCKNEEKFYIGNIFDGIDLNIIKKYLNQYNKIHNNTCKNCLLFKRCQNDCIALNNRVNNDLLIPDEVSCFLNQIAIKESDRILDYFLKTKNECFYKNYPKLDDNKK